MHFCSSLIFLIITGFDLFITSMTYLALFSQIDNFLIHILLLYIITFDVIAVYVTKNAYSSFKADHDQTWGSMGSLSGGGGANYRLMN